MSLAAAALACFALGAAVGAVAAVALLRAIATAIGAVYRLGCRPRRRNAF